METLRPTYRLHIGQFGMSNALKIARRLKLPRDLLQAGPSLSERRRQTPRPEMAQLQQLREEAEKAREEALAAQHEAERQARGVAAEDRAAGARGRGGGGAARGAAAAAARTTRCSVPRFDKPGRIVRVDHKRNLAVVSVGLGQWEVPLDEVFPAEK